MRWAWYTTRMYYWLKNGHHVQLQPRCVVCRAVDATKLGWRSSGHTKQRLLPHDLLMHFNCWSGWDLAKVLKRLGWMNFCCWKSTHMVRCRVACSGLVSDFLLLWDTMAPMERWFLSAVKGAISKAWTSRRSLWTSSPWGGHSIIWRKDDTRYSMGADGWFSSHKPVKALFPLWEPNSFDRSEGH